MRKLVLKMGFEGIKPLVATSRFFDRDFTGRCEEQSPPSVFRCLAVGLVPRLRDLCVGKPSDDWLGKHVSNHREHGGTQGPCSQRRS